MYMILVTMHEITLQDSMKLQEGKWMYLHTR
jgi:hypothetical protein